jgi:hypothetical protein
MGASAAAIQPEERQGKPVRLPQVHALQPLAPCFHTWASGQVVELSGHALAEVRIASPRSTRTPRRLDQVAPMVALMTLGVPKAAPTLAMYKLEASSPRPNAMLAG